LFGGTGNDWYMIGSSSDTIVEKAGEGTADRVFASVSFALAADDDIEIMSTNFHAGTAAINLTGNALAQDIYGNEGNNILNGGGGDDWMYGRGGDDQFYVGSANDQVFERAGEGYDRVWASVSYTLAAGASIERLTTTNHFGTAAINLTGNELAQDIYGNDGNNIIRSGGGDDWLFGRSGDDQFYVDSPNALVFERAGEGFDRVWARSNYVLSAGSSIELLTTDNHFGTTAINLTGNELNQSIYGNDGSNVLVGGGGDDSMFGRSGDDVFIVDSLGDLAMERAGEGFDTVRTRGDYTLASGSSVERLLVDNGAGSSRAYLTGNELAQEIRGDNGDNVLDGKLGADSLFGGGGADLFLFTGQLGGGNVDAILDFASASDRIGLFQGTFSTLAKGALDPNAFRTGASAQDADDRIIYDPATGALWYDADGSGAGAAVQFASLQPGTALTASDFLVI
jgi:serralysin